jgi:hypothetical protein
VREYFWRCARDWACADRWCAARNLCALQGSAQSLPRDLSLAADRSLLQRFAPELMSLRTGAPVAPKAAGLRAEVYATLPGSCANATSLADACGVSVLGDGANSTSVTLMPWVGLVAVNATLQGNGQVRAGPLPPACTRATCGGTVGGGWRIHAIVDHSIVEVIVNNATAFVVYAAPASENATQVAMFGSGAQRDVGSLQVWQLKAANNL